MTTYVPHDTFAPTTSVPASKPEVPERRDPARTRWALIALLLGTGLLYLWQLDINGWANAYYTAAAQAAGTSWKAWFFGSFDASNFITVDKPPASLWVMGLSVRLFGLNSWAVLVPQALMGVASVWLVFATVRRWFSAQAGLIAGLVLAVTPVAVLMFRFNNPDALLVLLLIAAAYATTRAIESGSWQWLALAGMFVGFGFLSKMMQAFLVLPGFVAAYGVAADISVRRRSAHLLGAFAATVVSAGWWVAIVELWPQESRPYIGGSQTNSVLELIFGYNGFGRLTGEQTGSVVPGGGTGQAAMWGETGWDRLFSASFGGQIAWLLPAAILGFVVMLWVSRREPRTDRTRAAALIWGGWLAVTAVVISFGQGIIHEYYTVALAPAIGVGVGAGAWLLWQRRDRTPARLTLAAAVFGTAMWAIVLLQRSPDFAPWLAPLIGLLGGIAAAGIAFVPTLGSWTLSGAVAMSVLAVVAAPLAYSIDTVSEPATGSLPSAGPTVVGARGPGGGGFGQVGPGQGGRAPGFGGPGGLTPPWLTDGSTPPWLSDGASTMPGLPPGVTGDGTGSLLATPGGPTAQGGGMGGLLDASTPSAAVAAALEQDAEQYRWVLATTGSQSAAGYQIATQQPVMSIGGFNGTDPAPTLSQFQAYVANGEIHYYLVGGGPGGGLGAAMGGSDIASQIQTWVEENFATVTVDGVTFYDLTDPVAGQAQMA